MLDLTCNNLKRLDDERLKIEVSKLIRHFSLLIIDLLLPFSKILDSQLKRTQETYFNALDKFGNLPIHVSSSAIQVWIV